MEVTKSISEDKRVLDLKIKSAEEDTILETESLENDNQCTLLCDALAEEINSFLSVETAHFEQPPSLPIREMLYNSIDAINEKNFENKKTGNEQQNLKIQVVIKRDADGVIKLKFKDNGKGFADVYLEGGRQFDDPKYILYQQKSSGSDKTFAAYPHYGGANVGISRIDAGIKNRKEGGAIILILYPNEELRSLKTETPQEPKAEAFKISLKVHELFGNSQINR